MPDPKFALFAALLWGEFEQVFTDQIAKLAEIFRSRWWWLNIAMFVKMSLWLDETLGEFQALPAKALRKWVQISFIVPADFNQYVMTVKEAYLLAGDEVVDSIMAINPGSISGTIRRSLFVQQWTGFKTRLMHRLRASGMTTMDRWILKFIGIASVPVKLYLLLVKVVNVSFSIAGSLLAFVVIYNYNAGFDRKVWLSKALSHSNSFRKRFGRDCPRSRVKKHIRPKVP